MAGPRETLLLPIQVVLFPSTRIVVRVVEPRLKEVYEASRARGVPFAVARILASEGSEPVATPRVGTLAEVDQVERKDESLFLLCRGTRRVRLASLDADGAPPTSKVEEFPQPQAPTAAQGEAARQLQERFDLYVERVAAFARSMGGELRAPKPEPGRGAWETAYAIAGALALDGDTKQRLLETDSLDEIIAALRRLLDAELEFLAPDTST